MDWKEEYLKNFELRLKHHLISGVGDNLFKEALIYQFYPAGKRLRPLLVAAAFQDLNRGTDLGYSENLALDFGVAIEILHTASLIHDDLPALDNDLQRRGRATLHVSYGEGRALLVGDYLIARAYALIAESLIEHNLNKTLSIQIFADCFSKVCYGQDLDIRNCSVNLEDVLALYDLKTSALFKAALCGVLSLYFEDHSLLKQAEGLADSFGRAFQILNDIKDVSTFDGKHIERVGNSDQKNQRTTALNLLQEEEREDYLRASYQNVWKKIEELEISLSKLTAKKVYRLDQLRDVLTYTGMLAN